MLTDSPLQHDFIAELKWELAVHAAQIGRSQWGRQDVSCRLKDLLTAQGITAQQ